MKTLSIKTKLVVSLVTILGVGGAAIVGALRMTFEHDALLVAEQSVSQATASFRTLAENETRLLQATLEAISQDQVLTRAFVAGDRAALLAETQTPYATLKASAGVTNWSFPAPMAPPSCG